MLEDQLSRSQLVDIPFETRNKLFKVIDAAFELNNISFVDASKDKYCFEVVRRLAVDLNAASMKHDLYPSEDKDNKTYKLPKLNLRNLEKLKVGLEKYYDGLEQKKEISESVLRGSRKKFQTEFSEILLFIQIELKKQNENKIIIRKQINTNEQTKKTVEQLPHVNIEITAPTYSSALSRFQQSTWNCYDHGKKFISKKLLHFGKIDYSVNNIPVTLESAQPHRHEWEGFAKCDKTEGYLIITLVSRQSQELYIHFMLRINPKANDITLCIGHVTYQHPYADRVVSDTVVLEKILDTAKTKDAIPYEFRNNIEDISPPIRKLLSDRTKNHMSMPQKVIITSLDLLEYWTEEDPLFKHPVTSDPVIGYLTGQYKLFYRLYPHLKESLVEDELQIRIADNQEFYKVEYSHKIEGITTNWEGFGHISFETHLFSVYLPGPYIEVVTKNGQTTRYQRDKPIIFLLNIPPIEIIQNFDTLTGMAAGVRDSRGAVGRLILAVKLNENNNFPEHYNIDAVNKFFDSYALRSWVRPPTNNPVYKFSNLEKATQEGMGWQTDIAAQLKKNGLIQ